MGCTASGTRSPAVRSCWRLWAAGVAAVLASACSSSGEATQSTIAPTSTTANTFVSCEPVPRFRLGDIEYENQQFDDLVSVSDLGPVVGEVSVHPAALDQCESVVLHDGEGSLPAGTKIYEIVGVDRSVALTASYGNDVYLRYIGRPVS